jgi:hypothetical protein
MVTMKSSNLVLALAALTVLSPATTVIIFAETITDEELASYGLTLEDFNAIHLSESPADFGGLPSAGDTDQLWLDAAAFQYGVKILIAQYFFGRIRWEDFRLTYFGHTCNVTISTPGCRPTRRHGTDLPEIFPVPRLLDGPRSIRLGAQ